jgi:hypothetical protein
MVHFQADGLHSSASPVAIHGVDLEPTRFHQPAAAGNPYLTNTIEFLETLFAWIKKAYL